MDDFAQVFSSELVDRLRKQTANYFTQMPIQQYTDDRIKYVCVTYVAGIGVFYGFPISAANVHNIETMMCKLSDVRNKAFQCPSVPRIGRVYGSSDPTSQVDPEFYRCVIVEVLTDGGLLVCFIDYGNTAVIQPKDLFEVPKELRDFPVVCNLYIMKGVPVVIPSFPSSDRKNKAIQMTEWLAEQLGDKSVEVVPGPSRDAFALNWFDRASALSSSTVTVTVYMEGSNVNDKFMSEWGNVLTQLEKALLGIRDEKKPHGQKTVIDAR